MSAIKSRIAKIFEACIEIICGEHSFHSKHWYVCSTNDEARKRAENHIKEENSTYPHETHYKLSSITELERVDGYHIDYNLNNNKKNGCERHKEQGAF